MYKAENEIYSQYKALKKTYDQMINKKDEILNLLNSDHIKSITYIGCGSSLSLCKSAALSARLHSGFETNVIAAGDLMMNFEFYEDILKDSLLVVPSRSGSTTEVLTAVEFAKQKLGSKCLSLCAVEDSELSRISDTGITLPWAFDESVCQTRTVTNLYAADLMFDSFITGNGGQISEIEYAIKVGEELIHNIEYPMHEIAAGKWENAVVLADGELEGIAEEGALAFKEICQIQSNYYHILDVRHGPMVLLNEKTLVIIALTPYRRHFQEDLIAEISSKGSSVVTVGSGYNGGSKSGYHVDIPAYKNYAVNGIPFILVPQLISLNKALAEGINPDEPNGLTAWIKL